MIGGGINENLRNERIQEVMEFKE